ncbi:hypothetical protein SHLI107390_13870 [Shewanella livingstonensis]|uniref:Uncharacterized protein n=1 Tax=Shewanella livingstonensis TaxID=150120 RepID=A0A3G8LZB4_9GAMM|nr:hypothetical protein EGC82_15605 [Shewanella livingstonensis]
MITNNESRGALHNSQVELGDANNSAPKGAMPKQLSQSLSFVGPVLERGCTVIVFLSHDKKNDIHIKWVLLWSATR